MDRASRRSTEMLRILSLLKEKHIFNISNFFPTCVVVSLAVILQRRPRLRTATRETATGPQRLRRPLQVPADLDIYSAMGASAKWPPPHPATTHTHHTPVTIALRCYHMSLNNSHYVFFLPVVHAEQLWSDEASEWLDLWVLDFCQFYSVYISVMGVWKVLAVADSPINEHPHCAAALWLGIFTALRLPQTWCHK